MTTETTPMTEATPAPYDLVGAIMDYECGDLDEDGAIALFQHLLDTGLCNTLQGHYGRTTRDLLAAGYISRKA